MKNLSRRSLLRSSATLAAAFSLAGTTSIRAEEEIEALVVKGNIRQSVCYGNYRKTPLNEFCRIAKKLGLVGLDLIGPRDWDTLLENDMIVTMGSGVPGASIAKGFNRKEHHDKLIEAYETLIPVAAEKKVPNLICFSGNREGIDDEEGLDNCVIGLKRLMPCAEKHGVTIVMELLNSKDHEDYQADGTPWGGTLARKVGSERFKLLYDIYHMQRMEGDIVNTINEYKDVIGHYHTAGNPGRKDPDDRQEIYYPAVMKAIRDTGFQGFVAHEFRPKNGLRSLRQAIETCDIS